MRLKFRAFSNGQWWYSDDEAYLLKECDGELFLVEDTQFYLSDSPRYAKIGKAIQFTGLCDKNGKEIYEGDILLNKFEDVREIKYEPCHFYFEWNRKKIMLNDFFASEEVVIGNIHENPELLK